MAGLIYRVRNWASLVKFSHSIFALPFALSMFVIVARDTRVTASQFLLLVISIVSARTAAMGWNRYLDRDIDSKNPRTLNREIPAGKVGVQEALLLIVVSVLVFLIASAFLGTHCLILAPLVLGVLFLYSWTKRFTASAHLVLGVALSLAPGGVWYALTGDFSWLPIPLMVAVMLWVAGFDILYSCQDVSFDSSHGLKSIPVRVGVSKACFLARLLHLASIMLLLLFGYLMGMGAAYYVGTSIFAIVIGSQHRIISPNDLTRIDAAFFTRNGAASVIYLAGVLTDVVIDKGLTWIA